MTFEAGAGIVLAGGLIANLWIRRLWIPLAAAGVFVAMLVLGQIYPAVVQGFLVTPNAQSYELPYIEREIAGTRSAYGLGNVSLRNFTGDQPLTAQAVQNDSATIDNLRLWDFSALQDTYAQQQGIRLYYTFHDIDIDRYTVNNKYQSLEISAREFDVSKLPQSAQNWINQHLQYTHGYGAAASPVNAVVGEGLPDYVVGNIPPTGPLAITQPAIYFGELTDDNVIAPSTTREFDYPKGSQDQYTTYTGTHGVPLSGANRALWSLKTGDFNLLVSGQISPQSEILFRRNIVERVTELAPFLTFDGDPYLVVVDGKLYWIIDAYTIVFAGLMVGNELAVSAFVNPAVWRLESGPQAQALSVLARSLGRAMPVWYGLCLALLALESFLHFHQTSLAPLLIAAALWAGAIVLSISALVPINNRIASLNTAAPAPGWERDHRKWDALHRVRILLLILALLIVVNALVA